MDDETHELRCLGIEKNCGSLNHRLGTVRAADQQLIEHQGLKIHAAGNGCYRRAANGADPPRQVLSGFLHAVLPVHVNRDRPEHGQKPADPLSQLRAVSELLGVHGSTIRASPHAFTNLC